MSIQIVIIIIIIHKIIFFTAEGKYFSKQTAISKTVHNYAVFYLI